MADIQAASCTAAKRSSSGLLWRTLGDSAVDRVGVKEVESQVARSDAVGVAET